MKKTLLSIGLFLAFACVSYGQTFSANAQPTCSSPQSGAFATYAVAAGGSTNPVSLGMNLCGSYSTIVVTMGAPLPAIYTSNISIGIQDLTTGVYLDCGIVPGSNTCTFSGTAVSFAATDQVVFIVYIAGGINTPFVIPNLTWSAQ